MSIFRRLTFLTLFLTVLSLCNMKAPAAADQVGDFEVIVYRQPHFVGASMSWQLEPGIRQRLVKSVVRDWRKLYGNPSELVGSWDEGLVGSMKVGSKIGVYVFTRPDFCSTSTNLRSGRFKIKPGLHEKLGIWKGRILSMILYPMIDREPCGVLLMANPVEVTVSKEYLWVIPIEERRVRLPEQIQFLPLPQRERGHQMIFRSFHDFMGDSAVSIRVYGKNVKVELYSNADLKGKSLILPGQGSQETVFQLSTFNFQNDVSSARVFQDISSSDQNKDSAPSKVRAEAPSVSSDSEQRSTPSKVRAEAPPALDRDRRNYYCRQYADRALQQRSERIERTGSAPANDPVWSADWKLHYNWCMNHARTGQPEAGTKNRQDWLDQYVPTTPDASGGGISQMTMEFNTNRPGQDYKDFELDTPDPELCRDACANDPDCQSYTYVKPGIQGDQARCWLKKVVPGEQSDNCCVSGVKKPE